MRRLDLGTLLLASFTEMCTMDPKKSFRFKVFEVVENKLRTTEIILQRKNNIYFNYGMFIDPSDETSNLKSAIRIRTIEEE